MRSDDAGVLARRGGMGWSSLLAIVLLAIVLLAIALLAIAPLALAAPAVVADAESGDACPASTPRPLMLEATRAALAHGAPITIVALGSSSTQGVGASAPDRTYPARLQALLRAWWGEGTVTVLNRGVGGQTDDVMLARIGTDVLAEHPVLVIWQAGANAVLRQIDPALFGRSLDEGARRIKASGADLVLMDNQIAPRLTAIPGHARYDEITLRAAHAHHVSLFSRAALMRDWAVSDPSVTDMIREDGVHHTDRGYACVAAALARAVTQAVGRPLGRPLGRPVGQAVGQADKP